MRKALINNIFLIGVGVFTTTGISYSLNPVYSAQATADFNPSNFGDNNQNGNNRNIDQNTNRGNNGYNTGNNNNNGWGNNQPTTLNPNGNNGNYANNALPNNQNGNANSNNNNNNSSNNNKYGNNNNANGGNNVRNNNNQGNNWNSNQNNGSYNNNQPNAFTENYALKGKPFSATVYRKDRNNQLYKTTLNSNELRRAIVIFFGDWCPHCSRFLQNFSKNIPALTQAGVKIIFIGVPSVDTLQNWHNPTDADYNENLQKLNGFGIQLGNNMELVLLGDSASLQNNAVDSLPTMMAISNGRECFRGGADNSIEKAEFSNNDEVNQFLQVFNSFGNNNPTGSNVRLITTSGGNSNRSNKTKNHAPYKQTWGVDVSKTNMYTDLLNDGCTMTCRRKTWSPPVSTTYSYPEQYRCPPCPPCPDCPVCPKCATPIVQSAESGYQSDTTDEGSVTQLSPSQSPEKCTTCGCVFRRAFSKKCYSQPKKPKCRKVKCCQNKARN